MSDIEQQKGVSRRTVTKAMAWAAPAVAVAATIPIAAASVCEPIFSYGGGSCKCPGEGNNVKQYYLSICASDASGCPLGANDTIYVWKVKNVSGADTLTPAGGFPVAIPISQSGDGCSTSQRYDWIPEPNNSAGKLAFFYNFSSMSDAGAVWSDFIAAPPDCDDEKCGA